MVVCRRGMAADENGPEEHHDGEIFRDWEFLKRIGVWELGREHANVEKGAKIVELFARELGVYEES